jgi:hypothetical protein
VVLLRDDGTLLGSKTVRKRAFGSDGLVPAGGPASPAIVGKFPAASSQKTVPRRAFALAAASAHFDRSA